MKLKTTIYKFLEEPVYSLKFIKKKLIFNLIKRKIKFSKYSPFLKTLSIIPTCKCDLSCIMCGNWRAVNTSLNNNTIDFGIYKKLIDEVTTYDCNIVLTGGEPLLYDKWYELSKYIKSKNLRLDLQTNGWILEDFAEKVVEVVDNLNVSLDGIHKVHDTIRKKGSFEKIMRGLKKVSEIKMMRKRRKPYVIIIYTISDLNYKYLSQTIEYLKNSSIEIDTVLFIHQMFISQKVKDEYLDKFDNLFKMSDIFSGFTYIPEKINHTELSYQIEKVKTLSKKVSFNINFSPNLKGDDIKTYYDQIDIFPIITPKICITPFTDAFILPSGDVWICPLNIVGNIKEGKFSSFWTGEKARNFRRQIIREGKFRICKNCCGLYV